MKKLYLSLICIATLLLSFAITSYADWKFSKNVRGTFTTQLVYTNESSRFQRPVSLLVDFPVAAPVNDTVTVRVATHTQTNFPLVYILNSATNFFLSADEFSGLILESRELGFIIIEKTSSAVGTYIIGLESSH
tara:strand:+ start:134 stop:535 length:402 start_codon:yes stop_codon:yes gene_type:complete